MSTIEELAAEVDHASPALKTARQRPPAWASGSLLVSVVFIVAVVLAALAPGIFTHQNPLAVDLNHSFAPPSAAHIFGTDQSGRDVYSRVVHGTSQSLLIGIGATAIGIAGALVLGLAGGLGGRVLDGAVRRLIEILYAFPGLLLALVLIAIFGNGLLTQIISVGVASIPGYARMVRGQTLAVRGSPYVQAARALGHHPARILARSILPNAFRPLVVLITLGVGQSIVWAAALGFLGLGVQPPAPEWGAMLDAGRDYLQQAWWLDFFPGVIVVLFTLAVTTLGRHIQRLTEPGRER